MKKITFLIVLVVVLTMSSFVAFAQDGITVRIDSIEVEFNEDIGSPFIDGNNRTQVPFRATLEQYGAEVKWNNESRRAIAIKGDITIEVPIGEYYIIKNGEKITTDTVAVIKDNRTYLPIRSVIEAFGSEVQWDSGYKTVVITRNPIDANEVLLDSYVKSSKWENYESDTLIDMSINLLDEKGEIQTFEYPMYMNMVVFQKPRKSMSQMSVIVEYSGLNFMQPVMETYNVIEDDSIISYTGVYDENGQLNWVKSIISDMALAELESNDVLSSLDLNQKSIKDVKYFGNYYDEYGRSLLRLETTFSGKVFSEILGEYIEKLYDSLDQGNILTANLLKNLEDYKIIIYIDEDTKEVAGYEMDLTSMFSKAFSQMENISKEELDIFKNMKLKVYMSIVNINEAEDFEIPQEALNAPEM